MLGHCIPGCQSYGFDDEWKVLNLDPCKVDSTSKLTTNFQSTMITEWDLVCEDKWMKTFAKLLLFSGKLYFTLLLQKGKTLLLLLLKGKTFSSQVNFTFTKG